MSRLRFDNKTVFYPSVTYFLKTKKKIARMFFFSSFRKVSSKELGESRDKGSKPDITGPNDREVEALRSSTQVMGKEVKQSELRLHSAQQKLRDLNINIR